MSFEFLADPNVWLTLVTLSALEIVLGIDNLVFISIAVGRLPPEQRPVARRFGIAVACITRIGLLVSLAFLARMENDLFRIGGMGISIRDLILILGGAFLLVKGSMEIRELITGGHDDDPRTTPSSQVFWVVIAQIAVIDIVFSLDSVITAVGIADHIPVMIFAILLGAEVFNAFLALTQLPMQLADAIAGSGLPPYGVMVLLLVAFPAGLYGRRAA